LWEKIREKAFIKEQRKHLYISLSLRNNHQTKEEEVQDLQHHLSPPHLFLTLQKGKKKNFETFFPVSLPSPGK
jgi:hypothetical protein